MQKVFIESQVRNLISQVSVNEITFSRFVEILNEEAEKTISIVKMQKTHLQNEVYKLTDKLIDAGVEKPAIRIDQTKNA